MSSLKSLIQIKDLTPAQIKSVFSLARDFKNHTYQVSERPQVVALVFFEASTRTRMSFEMAALRTGRKTILFDTGKGTSLEKGESFVDTMMNIASMGPDLLVVRAPDELDLLKVSQKISIPILNAGWGKKEHPTQALLDMITLLGKRAGDLKQERLLFVGDVKHSRVVGSHIQLSQILNYEIGFCGPSEFMPQSDEASSNQYSKIKYFNKLEEGLNWATSLMLLRVQKERHAASFNLEDYMQNYSLDAERLKRLKKDQWILHPGPVNQGVEMSEVAYSDERSLILEQVSNGVAVRAALLNYFLET